MISTPATSMLASTGCVLISRAEGYLDRLALEAMDEKDLPYRIAFSATDMSARTAAVLAGVGIMAVPERTLPAQLAVVDDPLLPRLPDLRVGVFYGLDVSRIRKLEQIPVRLQHSLRA
jgi:DNA-binding transcriptional LysR family regulator